MTYPGTSRFPDPRTVPGDAPFAYGANYEPDVLVDAYAHGVFPWPYDDGEVYWWSPDPRAVIYLDGLRVSRSLRQTLRRGVFRCTIDHDFAAVLQACAEPHDGADSWLTDEYMDGYLRLHRLGVAHSVEVWTDDELVGGLYGVASGAVFTGESMFHRRTDASKVALVALRDHMAQQGDGVIDCQLPTDHLATMGAVAVARTEFLDLLERLRTSDRHF